MEEIKNNNMDRFISMENISFSINCDIKTTKCECHGRLYLGNVYLQK